MPAKGQAMRMDKTKRHGNARWSKEQIKAILDDIRSGRKKGDACRKHGISQPFFNVKLEQYHAGELR